MMLCQPPAGTGMLTTRTSRKSMGGYVAPRKAPTPPPRSSSPVESSSETSEADEVENDENENAESEGEWEDASELLLTQTQLQRYEFVASQLGMSVDEVRRMEQEEGMDVFGGMVSDLIPP